MGVLMITLRLECSGCGAYLQQYDSPARNALARQEWEAMHSGHGHGARLSGGPFGDRPPRIEGCDCWEAGYNMPSGFCTFRCKCRCHDTSWIRDRAKEGR